MKAPRALALGLALLLFTLPLAPARANDGDSGNSPVGAVLAAACGFALKAAMIAPVPWAGIAAVTCVAAFLDAAMSPDDPSSPPSPPPPPTP